MFYSKAITESVQIMDPDEEYITIASAEEQMSLTASARKKDIDDARGKMKGLSFFASALISSKHRPKKTHSSRTAWLSQNTSSTDLEGIVLYTCGVEPGRVVHSPSSRVQIWACICPSTIQFLLFSGCLVDNE